jgi:predicted metalloprotease
MVLAHEFMHIRYFKEVKAGRAPYKQGKTPELLADWFAGFYLAHRSWDHFIATGGSQNITAGVFRSMDQAFSMGDNNFTSPSHHGTHRERRAAFTSGSRIADNNRLQLFLATGKRSSPYTYHPDAVYALASLHFGL